MTARLAFNPRHALSNFPLPRSLLFFSIFSFIPPPAAVFSTLPLDLFPQLPRTVFSLLLRYPANKIMRRFCSGSTFFLFPPRDTSRVYVCTYIGTLGSTLYSVLRDGTRGKISRWLLREIQDSLQDSSNSHGNQGCAAVCDTTIIGESNW